MGAEPRIQINDRLVQPTDIQKFVNEEKDKLTEVERDQITMALKIDRDVKMGIVVDVQQELKEVNARKILYSATKRIDL